MIRRPDAGQSVVQQFGSGARYLGRGLRLWLSSPGMMLLGAIPALVVGIVYLAILIVLLLNIQTVTIWATPFADGWASALRSGTRVLGGIAIVAGVVLFGLYSFAAVALTIGDPLYERIWRMTETSLGGEPTDAGRPWWWSLGSTVRLVLFAVMVAVSMFLLGLVPVVGSVGALVLGALLGGWIIALELTGYAFEARGHTLKVRRRMLGASRATTLGFGVPTYLLFLVPVVAVIVMPAAVAGATMLARDAVLADAARNGR